ncbi:MAG TPA: CsbD family protein [Gaiellaceae bacterium]|jgi:uncharacterized protein YjbJ (UPF0337 family)|nr:CsbD family protein [Gaiellaceae bacterium]
MGWLDKLLGRGKQTAGGATGSRSMQEEGRHQEAAGEAEDRAATHEDIAQEERNRAAEERADGDST